MRALLTHSIARRLKSCAVVVPLVAAAALLDGGHAQALTTWNWSFTTDIADQYGSGTFTSADVAPTANAPIKITGISGTYARNGSVYNITGLKGPYDGIDDSVYWDGTSSSPINVNGKYSGLAGRGFSATLEGGKYFSLFSYSSGPVTILGTDFSGSDGAITSSSLSPVADPAPVPGPLPVLGAAAAFGWSRRMRRRLKPGADAS